MIDKSTNIELSTKAPLAANPCYTLRIELEKLGRFVAINQPSIIDEEGVKLCQKKIDALNTIWGLLDEICP